MKPTRPKPQSPYPQWNLSALEREDWDFEEHQGYPGVLESELAIALRYEYGRQAQHAIDAAFANRAAFQAFRAQHPKVNLASEAQRFTIEQLEPLNAIDFTDPLWQIAEFPNTAWLRMDVNRRMELVQQWGADRPPVPLRQFSLAALIEQAPRIAASAAKAGRASRKAKKRDAWADALQSARERVADEIRMRPELAIGETVWRNRYRELLCVEVDWRVSPAENAKRFLALLNTLETRAEVPKTKDIREHASRPLKALGALRLLLAHRNNSPTDDDEEAEPAWRQAAQYSEEKAGKPLYSARNHSPWSKAEAIAGQTLKTLYPAPRHP